MGRFEKPREKSCEIDFWRETGAEPLGVFDPFTTFLHTHIHKQRTPSQPTLLSIPSLDFAEPVHIVVFLSAFSMSSSSPEGRQRKRIRRKKNIKVDQDGAASIAALKKQLEERQGESRKRSAKTSEETATRSERQGGRSKRQGGRRKKSGGEKQTPRRKRQRPSCEHKTSLLDSKKS